MAATIPSLSNAFLRFPHCSTPISDHFVSTSLSIIPDSFRNPKPIPPSKSLSFSSTSAAAATHNDDDKGSTNWNRKGRIHFPDQDCSFSSEPAAVKMPTAPWMKGPLLLHPNQVLDLTRLGKKKNSANGEYVKPDRSLTGKVSGARGKKAMKVIFEGIEKLQETHDSEKFQKSPEESEFHFSLGELGEGENSKLGRKMPWEGDERLVFPRIKKEKVVTAAELSLDGELLKRLRHEAATMRRWVKVKKVGVTQAVVDQIRLIWKDKELARLKFDLPLSRNMDRAREIVETKTGGLVVWSKKDSLVVYRGCHYRLGLKTHSEMQASFAGGQDTSSLNFSGHKLQNITLLVKSDASTVDRRMSRNDGEMESVPINGSLYEREADRLLDGLGPRFIDWWMPKPLPVDADLLPEVVPGFKPPFRLCPPHARAKLTDDELTYLRKLARPLPTHFVLGRNRKLQGLAAAILKLWEKCHIVKIAVKWGIPNTNNAQMAYELKQYLTGGVLLLRNKFLIILYRGKDFVPCSVANLVAEREMELQKFQHQEEASRLNAIDTFNMTDESSVKTSKSGTLSEFEDIQSENVHLKNEDRELEVLQLEADKERLEKQLRNQERKLFILKMKIKRSAKELVKLSSAWRPAEQDADQEMITQEERECFRKIGLKMDSSLVLGRRGVFDGVIGGLHQHWKHREIVKVITMQRLFSQVIYTAKWLEAESGGILVSVDKLKEGHVIIIYRGKNYRRPLNLVPRNLLTKREALQRSLEMQRTGSLKFFANQRQKVISELKCKLFRVSKLNPRVHDHKRFTELALLRKAEEREISRG